MTGVGRRLRDLDERSGVGAFGDLLARALVPWLLIFAVVVAGLGVVGLIAGGQGQGPKVAFGFSLAALAAAGLVKLYDRWTR